MGCSKEMLTIVIPVTLFLPVTVRFTKVFYTVVPSPSSGRIKFLVSMRFTVVFGSLVASICIAATPSAAAREATTGSVLQSLPIRFEPSGHNGDFDARGLGYRMSVSATGGQVDLGAGTSIGFRIQDGNAGASVRPEKKQPGVTTYFLGSERRTSVPGYGRVTYGDVLP